MALSSNSPAPMAAWSATFFTRVHRYRSLLKRRWWVLLVCVSLAVCFEAYNVAKQPATFASTGRMWVNGKISLPQGQGTLYNEEWVNFFGTQILLMESREVQNRARNRVQALQPNLKPVPVDLQVSQSPRTSVFVFEAKGGDPAYVQAYLDACMDEYIAFKKEKRSQTSETTLSAITGELLRLEKEMRQGEDDLLNFQKENNVVFLQEQGNSAGSYLVNLNSQLADLKKEYQLLELLSLDQTLERDQKKDGNPAGSDDKKPELSNQGPESDYAKAKAQIVMLRAQRDELAQYLRPKHPKIIKLNEDIDRESRLLDIYRQQSVEQLASRKESIRLQMQNLENVIKEWETKALDTNRRMAEYQRLKANMQRSQNLYESLRSSIQTVGVNQNLDQDNVSVMERASPAVSIKPGYYGGMANGLVMGLLAGVMILFLIDRIDDRVNSYTELRDHFEEPVVGQIPEIKIHSPSEPASLLQVNDPRHMYAESYRNIRSSLLFMAIDGRRPKTLLLTSAIPNEGKSTVACNLAITMAFAGSNVLLVDADLRRGRIHDAFQVPSTPGLSEVLSGQENWRAMVRKTSYPNLSLLPRGHTPHHPGELFLNQGTEKFLNEAYNEFDYILIDTAPILATDDTTSLAPKIDGVFFLLRSSYTSARLTRNALNALYQRQVNVLGLIFNCVNTSLPEYHYYRYKEYYS